MKRVVFTVARGLVLLAGLRFLYRLSLKAFGGGAKLWMFEQMEQHRYTAMAMLTGTLKLRNALSKLGHDEQVYNGASYTNWSFGVPLMQVPFHALAAKMPSLPQKFFPDRAIYFAYFMAMVPCLWAAFDRLLATRESAGASKLRRHVVSWSATVFVLVTAFFPLMSCRFIVYEEGLCYFMVAEFLALSAYIFAIAGAGAAATAVLGVGAGLGLLIRPTGLPYLGIWCALLLLEQRTWRKLVSFSVALLPLLVFWGYSNWVKGGSPLAIGFNNSMPWFDYHTPMFRFGSVCADTPTHAYEATWRLFKTFFAVVDEESKRWPYLDECHFKFEDRPPPSGGCYAHEPYFGPIVLAALVWMLLHQLRRRESRLAFYVPIAAIVVLFGTFVWAGAGFAWRYAGDFWPLIVAATVQYVRFLPRGANPLLGLPLALALLAPAYATYTRSIEPSVTTLQVLDDASANTMWADFTNSRYAQDKPMPSEVTCTNHPDWPYHNGQGWNPGCTVSTFTNLFVGVPEKNDDHYQLKFHTEGVSAPTLRVYLNGRNYVAYRAGDSYVADVNIRYDRLTSPIVMTTIEWTRALEPVPGMKLMSLKLS